MKQLIITATIFLAAAFNCTAQEHNDDMMKAWQAFMTPGEQHKMLARSTGTWNEDITMWMAEGAPAQKSTAVAENKMIMNGLYQQSTHKGNFEGMPFEGLSTVGYDNARKIYMSTWIDNMGTSIAYMEGKWNEATKTVEFKGTQTNPMTGKTMNARETIKFIDDNNQYLEMFQTENGKERKTMEIKLSRK